MQASCLCDHDLTKSPGWCIVCQLESRERHGAPQPPVELIEGRMNAGQCILHDGVQSLRAADCHGKRAVSGFSYLNSFYEGSAPMCLCIVPQKPTNFWRIVLGKGKHTCIDHPAGLTAGALECKPCLKRKITMIPLAKVQAPKLLRAHTCEGSYRIEKIRGCAACKAACDSVKWRSAAEYAALLDRLGEREGLHQYRWRRSSDQPAAQIRQAEPAAPSTMTAGQKAAATRRARAAASGQAPPPPKQKAPVGDPDRAARLREIALKAVATRRANAAAAASSA